MTMLKLDFEPSPYGGFSEKYCRRGAVFALRILLSNPDVLAGYMDDCEYLLKLLGGDAVWPDRLSRLLAKGLANEDDGIDAAIVQRRRNQNCIPTKKTPRLSGLQRCNNALFR